jgi:hypothetical protein
MLHKELVDGRDSAGGDGAMAPPMGLVPVSTILFPLISLGNCAILGAFALEHQLVPKRYG